MTKPTELLKPGKLGNLSIKNRVFMAPLTRNRAQEDGTPKELAVEYYAQRASAGLIIAEATQINPMGKGYLDTPGIHSSEQIASWKKITDAVHSKGGLIFLQLWHVGRISHSSLLPDGAAPLAPSAIRAESQTFTANGFEPVSEPRAMTLDDIQSTIADYRSAAKNAMQAGFDGVELHGANGYLINQFLVNHANKRDDQYGGSIENRARFLLEALRAIADEIGADKTGLRLSPTGKFNDIVDDEARQTFTYVYEQLNQLNLAYLHVVEGFPGIEVSAADKTLVEDLRKLYKGFYIANGGYELESGESLLKTAEADAIAYGRPFISNPDLPERIEKSVSWTPPDDSTFFGGNEKGYTDYPRAT